MKKLKKLWETLQRSPTPFEKKWIFFNQGVWGSAASSPKAFLSFT